jgi:retinol dehydrogenase-12
VYLAARSEEKSRAAIDDICKSTNKSDIHFLNVNLADLTSVRKAAEEYMSKEQELHVLINNAWGFKMFNLLIQSSAHARAHSAVLYSPGIGPQTTQGYDIQFGVNVLGPARVSIYHVTSTHHSRAGHYFLTVLLMPTLLRTAKGEASGTPCPVRVVSVSSDAHETTAPSRGIVWESLQKGEAATPTRKKLVGHRLYGQSKLVRSSPIGSHKS